MPQNAFVGRIEQENKELKKYLVQLNKHNRNLKHVLDQIMQSKAYRLWQKYATSKKNAIPILKQSVKNAAKAAVPYGLRIYVKKQLAKISLDRREFEKFKKELIEQDIQIEQAQPLTDTVTVIFPTKNAGPLFDLALKKIILQKNIPAPELIIVDSGSTDGTLEIAKAHNAKIIQIQPSDFSHSKARNIGAKQATGDYVIFTVQDAFMMNEYTIYELLTLLKYNKAVAGSGRQIPRADADIYASWQIEEFVKFISPGRKNLVISLDKDTFRSMKPEQKRGYCTIDDVFSIFKKDIFDKMEGFNESFGYGEDLEMGQRLIANGKPIAFLYANGVVHSHTRPAEYICKRYYTDTTFLHNVFAMKNVYSPFSGTDIKILLQNLAIIGHNLEAEFSKTTQVSDIIKKREHLLKPVKTDNTISTFTSVQFIQNLCTKMNISHKLTVDRAIGTTIAEQLSHRFTQASEFIDQYFNFKTKQNPEMTDLIDKIFGDYCGIMLAHYYSANQKKTKDLQIMDTFLKSSI